MRRRILLSAAVFLGMTLALSAQTLPILAGKWQADKQGSPWVIVNVTRANNSQLSGTIVFFVFDRAESQSSASVIGKLEAQLVDPKLVGNVFSFAVKNQQADVTTDPSSSDMLNFTMILKDETHATLKSNGRAATEVLMVKKE